jgi:hypothetical protein
MKERALPAAGESYLLAMNTELELVRAKITLAELQLKCAAAVPNQMNSGGNGVVRMSANHLTAKEFLVSVGEFDGEKGRAAKWLDLLDTTVASYEGTDGDKYRVARGLLVGLARSHVNKSAPSDWSSLRKTLLLRCVDDRSLMDVYAELKSRVKRGDESLEAYVSAMEEIADDLIPGEDLIPIIIRGIGYVSPFTPMLASAKTVPELLRLLPSFKRNTSLLAPETQNPRQHPRFPPSPSSVKKCYNCQEKGHLSFACPKPQVRKKGACFACNSTEHQMNNCPRRTNAAIEEAVVNAYQIRGDLDRAAGHPQEPSNFAE